MSDINDLIMAFDVRSFSAPDARGLFTISEHLDKLIWIVKEQGDQIESLQDKLNGVYT